MGVTTQAYGTCDVVTDIWCMTNVIDTAALTGTSATSSLGVERLRDPRMGVKWRTATGGSTLTITVSPAQAIQVFGIFGLSDHTATFSLEMGTGPGLSDVRSGAWAPNIDAEVGQGLWLNVRDLQADPAPLVAEIRLTVNEDHIDIGRVWAGDYHWTPCVGHIYSSQQGINDTSTRQRTVRSGAVFADAGFTMRAAQVAYDAIPTEDWDGPVFKLAKIAGVSRQVLFVPNYAVYPPERHAICGYNEGINPITALGFNRWEKQFILMEAG